MAGAYFQIVTVPHSKLVNVTVAGTINYTEVTSWYAAFLSAAGVSVVCYLFDMEQLR